MLSSSVETRIAIIGANYAGLSVAKNLCTLFATEEEHRIKISIFDKRDGFVHDIGMTRGLACPEFGEGLWIDYTEFPWINSEMIEIVKAEVVAVYKNHLVLEDKKEIPFDYAIIGTGLHRNPPIWPIATSKKEFVDEITEYNKKTLLDTDSVVVVGAGAVGVEMAADLKCEFPEKKVTLIHSRAAPIVGPFSQEFRDKVVEELEIMGVELVFNERVKTQEEIVTEEGEKKIYEIITEKGRRILANAVINCTGTGKPASSFLRLDETTEEPLLTDSRLIRVRESMQLADPAYPHIFAIGDVNDFQDIKLAGAAIYQGYFAARNIHKLVTIADADVELEKYPRLHQHLILIMGREHGASETADGVGGLETVRSLMMDDMGLTTCKKTLGYFGEAQ
ncbi:hypothetical protein K7432_014291 [Basidiobolus ranarum]|uniref:FAD/NAD(P)-binding domain-containing protein n=1 Tax=Basidiobolus ranarum TaxID=34480 RepID=A0ABR2WHU4_9FUNG